MSADSSDAKDTKSGHAAPAGWNCKPFEPGKQKIAVFAFFVGLVCGLVPLFLAGALEGRAFITGWVVSDDTVALLLDVAITLLVIVGAGSLLLAKGSDCVYMDDRCIVRLRRAGRAWAKTWAIRLDAIKDVSFRGGSFVTGELTARLRGRFVVRWICDPLASERNVRTVTFSVAALRLHPGLLERLIALAEPKATSSGRRRALESARQFAARAETPKPEPSPTAADLPTQPLDALKNEVDRVERILVPVCLVFYVSLLAAFGVILWLHMRGSMLGFFLPAAPLLLAGTPPIVLTAMGFSDDRRNRVIGYVVTTPVLVAAAVYFWYVPALWPVVAAAVIFVLYCLAATRYGRRAARVLAAVAVSIALVYAVAFIAHFGNWGSVRTKRVFALRFSMAACPQMALSPDGKSLVVCPFAFGPATEGEQGVYGPLNDSPLHALRSVARLVTRQRWSGEFAFPITFVPLQGGPVTSFLVKAVSVTPLWAPDSRRIAFDTWHFDVGQGTSGTIVWLAEPARRSLVPLYSTSTALVLLPDAWSSDSRRLSAFCLKGSGDDFTREQITIHIDEGRTEVEPAPWTTSTTDRIVRRREGAPLLGFGEPSPNDDWIATQEGADGKTTVAIYNKRALPTETVPQPRDGASDAGSTVTALSVSGQPPVAAFVVDSDENYLPLIWSPDSRKLAVAGRHRVWIHDLDAQKTIAVKTWCRTTAFPDILWSPDSSRFYFARSCAHEWIGLEIVRVHVRE